MTTFEYAQEKLFGPLGIKNVFWDADPSGVTQGGIGLMLTPRDMAKLGVLYLNQGKWHGKQVVPASWIEASTQRNANEYAYQWWQNENGFTALGHAGQFIFMIPAQDIVMVTTAALPGTTFLDPLYFVDMILLAVKSDEPLPQSAAEQELAERIEEIANPLAKEVPEFPQMAASIEGKTLILDENPGGWKTARLDFEGDQAWLTVTTDADPEERKFAIGLDGIYRKTEQKALINPGIAENEKRTFLNPYELNFLLGMPIDGAVAMKGEWTFKDEFTLTVQDLRDYDREMLSFRFTSPDVLIFWRSHMDGSILSVRGKIE